VSAELEHIWSRVQGQLAQSVDEPTYRIWLESLHARELAAGELVIETPRHGRAWVEERFGALLQASVELVAGPGTVVALVAAEDEDDTPGTTRRRLGGGHGGTRLEQRSATAGAGRRRTRHAPAPAGGGLLGNPKLTFEQFVIGDSNHLAHAAALTVAEMPAQAYNPLFICGPPGVGKTHLLSAIATLLLSHDPGLTVRCITGEAFTNEFIGALEEGHTEAFKARFREVDVLLVDDVQFLERKVRTEEEFFHTFNALLADGRQIVLSSDRPPRDLQALEDRLRDRFEAGLVADVHSPDLTTRMTILRKRVHDDHIELADELPLAVIAEAITTNVRALEGALIRVVAFSSLTGRALTGELAQEVLDTLYPALARQLAQEPRSLADIEAATCEQFGLTPQELLSAARTLRITRPRQLAMYLARELTSESLPAIGRHFGGRDHTTVLHAWRRTVERMVVDEDVRNAVEQLRERLATAVR
jgi:chromosomal replication initiator protein